MTTITTSKNIFENTSVVLDYLGSPTAAFGAPPTTEDIRWISIAISGEENEAVFKEFYENFLASLQRDYGIYFFYADSFKAQKSKIRSYVKLFYQLRRAKAIPETHLVEKEIDLADKQSIIAGIIQVDELDTAYVVDELASNGFKFGLVVGHSTNAGKHAGLASLGAQLNEALFTIDKSVRVNHLSVIKQLLTPNAFFYSYLYDGKDDLIFTIYAGAEVYPSLRKKMEESLPTGELIADEQATKQEANRVIDLYFRDWRPVRNRE